MADADPRVVELLRMFDTYNRTPTPSQIADYLETVGPCTAEELHQARIDAMRESGRFVPTPGELAACLRAIRRTRPGDAPAPDYSRPALPAPDLDADRRVLRELFRRLRERVAARGGGLRHIGDRLAVIAQVEKELHADLERLAAAKREAA